MNLTKTLCDKLQPKEKSYKKFDGEGLYLEIMPSGKKYWRLKYYYLGREKRISLGKYPVVTLNQARQKRTNAKQLLDAGIDPSENRIEQNKLIRRQQNNTFQIVAKEWYGKKKDNWSVQHAKNVWYRLERNVFPYIGKSPITKITTPDILNLLRIMENRNALEVARRTRQICGQIFRYAIQTGRCNNNPAIHLVGAIKTNKTKHFPSLDIREVPDFLEAIYRNDARLFSRTRRAIWLSLYTFARPGEIRKFRWEHLSLEDKQWIIPADMMKSGRDHIVPLSSQSIKILQAQKEETGRFNTPWVFPGQVQPLKPMSKGSVNMGIKRLGFHGKMTAHGVRALARTTIREKLKYYPDIIEAQLAHKPIGSLGAAYDRAQFLDERRKMMQDWADYLDSLTK